jgi:hypothetical protein
MADVPARVARLLRCGLSAARILLTVCAGQSGGLGLFKVSSVQQLNVLITIIQLKQCTILESQ